MGNAQHTTKSILWMLNAGFDKGQGLFADSLLDSLEGVTAEQAAARPNEEARSIGEIVNHVTYWKNAILGQLAKDKASEGSAPAEDWAPVQSESDWETALTQLQDRQAALAEQLASFTDEDLDKAPDAEGWPVWKETLQGTVAHDIYHTGQVIKLRQVQGF